jgi:hypothetical protein
MQSVLFVYLTNKDVFHTFFSIQFRSEGSMPIAKTETNYQVPFPFSQNFNVSINV